MATPSKGAGRSGRAPKLRLSCDACAAAKVRCSKEQPQCERCASSSSQCVYGPSRRSGKPPRDPNRQSIASNTDSIKGEYAASDNHPSPRPVPTPRHSMLGDQDDDLDAHFGSSSQGWSTQIPHSFARWNEGSMGHGLDSFGAASPFRSMEDPMLVSDPFSSHHNSGYSTDNSTPSAWHIDPPGGPFSGLHSTMALPPMDFQDLIPTETVRSAGSTSSGASTSVSSDYSLFSGHPSLQHQQLQRQNSCGGHNCYALAHSTLSSLHFQHPIPSTSPSRPSSAASSRQHSVSTPQASVPSLDSVLRNNKVATQNVLQLLSCPCAADAHMALLYASITSKILIWYQVAAGIKVSSSSPTAVVDQTVVADALSGAGGQSNTISPQYSMGSTFADEPVKIGSFSPDEEYQVPMLQVLILGELGKAGVLIDALSRMHGSDDGDSEMRDINVAPAGPAKNLYATLGSWLKAELARTTDEVRRGSMIPMGL